MTTIRRVVSAARPTVNTFFETLSTVLTNIVDTILGKSSEGFPLAHQVAAIAGRQLQRRPARQPVGLRQHQTEPAKVTHNGVNALGDNHIRYPASRRTVRNFASTDAVSLSAVRPR